VRKKGALSKSNVGYGCGNSAIQFGDMKVGKKKIER
jgi:hypothetical protein